MPTFTCPHQRLCSSRLASTPPSTSSSASKHRPRQGGPRSHLAGAQVVGEPGLQRRNGGSSPKLLVPHRPPLIDPASRTRGEDPPLHLPVGQPSHGCPARAPEQSTVGRGLAAKAIVPGGEEPGVCRRPAVDGLSPQWGREGHGVQACQRPGNLLESCALIEMQINIYLQTNIFTCCQILKVHCPYRSLSLLNVCYLKTQPWQRL